MSNTNTFRVWHIPQIPGEPFHVPVKSPEEGKKILDVLADYDTFQFEHNIKPDYSNVGGLEAIEEGEWVEWCDDEGYSINELALDKNGNLVL